jgi:dTDP-4-dehydrorhamnose reductase
LKVLVTGASGQVGRALVARAPRNAEVVGLPRGELDVSNGAEVSEKVKRLSPDIIVNAAAYTAVDRAETEPVAAQSVNDTGARNLAVAAREAGARMLHFSTDFVFDGTASTPYRPDSPTGPLSVYGRTKLAGERSVLGVLPDAIVLRTSWIYAAQGRNFVLTMLRLMKEKGEVRVVSDQVGTPTSASSLAAAAWSMLAAPGATGIHHWTDGGVASWYDFAVAIAEEAHSIGLLESLPSVSAIETVDYPTPARRPSFSVLDKSSVKPFGLVPDHWRKGLRTVLREILNA